MKRTLLASTLALLLYFFPAKTQAQFTFGAEIGVGAHVSYAWDGLYALPQVQIGFGRFSFLYGYYFAAFADSRSHFVNRVHEGQLALRYTFALQNSHLRLFGQLSLRSGNVRASFRRDTSSPYILSQYPTAYVGLHAGAELPLSRRLYLNLMLNGGRASWGTRGRGDLYAGANAGLGWRFRK